MTGMESDALQKVYAARSPEELAEGYSLWAADYDRETLALGYCLPFVITSWVARHVPADAGPLLDAGCGTGLAAPYLKALGYTNIEGLDFSDDMLALARSRNVYSKLTKASLLETLPFSDGYFAAFFCSGVFTQGHVTAVALDELIRVVRPGGKAVFVVRDSVLESGGFLKKFDMLTQDKTWSLVEESKPYRSFAVAEPDVFAKTFVFERF